MADHDMPEHGDPRSAAGVPALDLAEALGGLDRATRNFTRRLSEGRMTDEPGQAAAPAAADQDDAFEQRLQEAEREAREYLDHAKRRADSLVRSMVGAVEREAAEMQREAEAGIRARWQQVEVDAERHLGEARRVADGMVAERQQRIATLSDGISSRAQALTAGMDDAERVREQFDSFVRALSRTADRIAGTPPAPSARASAPPPQSERIDGDRPSAIAA
jgi:F0F1-type ATP synthase membrane subunit b/b'